MTCDARVHVDVDGAAATITLSRPDRRNAQTPLTWLALQEMGQALPEDVRVVAVRGVGATFSAGLDRAMFSPEGIPGAPTFRDVARAPAAEGERIIEAFQQGFARLSRPDIISVAAIQGHAIGAGFQLALACDLRIAADDAQFSMPETSLGLVPDLGGTRALRKLVGYSRALEICATGRAVPAAEAARIGLVTTVVPRAALDRAVDDLVNALLRLPGEALTETKALLRRAGRCDADEQLAAERQAQLRLLRRRASERSGH